MPACSVCGDPTSAPDSLCDQCRVSQRLLAELASLPTSLKEWGLDRSRVWLCQLQEEKQKVGASSSSSLPKGSPRPGREDEDPKKKVKEEVESKEEALAEVVGEGEKPESEVSEKKDPTEKKEKHSKKKKEKKEKTTEGSRTGGSRSRRKSEGNKEKKSRTPPKSKGVADKEKEEAEEKEVQRERKEKRRRSESRERGRNQDKKKTRESPPSSRRPPEPERSPIRLHRKPSPPPGEWEARNWYSYWRPDKKWVNKGRTKVERQQARREYRW